MAQVSQKLIAEKAGINQSEVSRVLNNKPTWLSEDKKERILQIARDLNYQPNRLAQSLKTGRTNLIGFTCMEDIYAMMNDPYTLELFLALGRKYAGSGTRLVLQSYADILDRQPGLSMTTSRLVDGVIYILFSQNIKPFKENELPLLRETSIPFVAVHSCSRDLGCSNIGLDCVKGGELAAQHFIEHGYKDIGFVGYRQPRIHIDELKTGLARGLKTAGGSLNSDRIYTYESFTTGAGQQVADELADSNKALPRALLVAHELVAHGLIARLTEQGVRVPEDVAVMGFGGNTPGVSQTIQISAVHQPAVKKAELAVDYLARMIENPELKGEAQFVKLEPELTLGTTCGCKKTENR